MSNMALSPLCYERRIGSDRKPNIVPNVKATQNQKLQSAQVQARLRVCLLGPISIVHDGKPVIVASKKSRALLGYLVQREGTEVARGVLTGLLWGERSESQARGSLRQSLSELRGTLPKSARALVATKEAITWMPGSAWVDTKVLETAAGSKDEDTLRDAAELLGGEFMEGLSIGEATFEQWLAAERERFRLLTCRIYVRLMEQEEDAGQLEEALMHGMKLVSHDPLQEHVHRALMRIYAAQGRHDAALAQYEKCRRELANQLNVQPESETEDLARSIRASRRKAPTKPRGSLSLTLPDRPSVAVLPFQNMSGDSQQDYFADGITEDITTELSRFKSIFVVARRSSFHYRGLQTKLQDICRELGVAYAVQGSVRKGGDRIRIAVQLIEAASGTELWAERYDRKFDDIFSVQDEVTQTVVGAFAHRIEDDAAAIARKKPQRDMQIYDYWLQGKRALDLSTLEMTDAAISLFHKALVIAPDYAGGFAGLAEATYNRAFFLPLPKPFGDLLHDAFVFAERSVALDDADARPHMVLAWACMFRREFDRAQRHFELSSSLNPNDADLIMQRAGGYALLGRAEDGIELANNAIRLNPYHPDWYLEYVSLINFNARRYEAVLATSATSRDTYPSSPAWRAAASVYLGQYSDARLHADDLIAGLRGRLDGTSGATFQDYVEYLCGVIPFKRPEDSVHLLDGLRKAHQAK